MRGKIIIGTATAAALVLSVASAQSQQHDRGERGWGNGGWDAGVPNEGHGEGGLGMRHGRRPGRGMVGMDIVEALHLTDAQQEKVKSIHREAAKELARKRADIRVAEVDLHGLMDTSPPNRKAIHQQIEEVASLRAQLRIVQVDQQLDVLAQLTEEQQELFHKLHRGRGPGGSHGPGPGMGRGERMHGRRPMEGGPR